MVPDLLCPVDQNILNDFIVFNAVLNITSVISRRQCSYTCFPGVSYTGTPHKILPNPLSAFLSDHFRNNGQS